VFVLQHHLQNTFNGNHALVIASGSVVGSCGDGESLDAVPSLYGPGTTLKGEQKNLFIG
jgi:hypothetical protein